MSLGHSDYIEPVGGGHGHKSRGLFIAYGKDVKSDFNIETSILNVMPTILHYLGEPIPADVDGRVLTEIFLEDSSPKRRKVKVVEALKEPSVSSKKREISVEEEKRIMEHLKALGYL